MVRKKLDQKYFLSNKNSLALGFPISKLQIEKIETSKEKSKNVISHSEIFQKLQQQYELV